jgi:hypothetical protein
MSVTSGAAALYYICLTVIGGFLVLNLLVAILYELFKNEVEGKMSEGGEGPLMRKVRCWAASVFVLACYSGCLSTPTAGAGAAMGY